MIRRPLLTLLAAAAISALPSAAHASSTQESIFEDDFQILQQDGDAQRRALDDFVALGADTVRSLVYWNQIAPDAGSRRRPKGFDAKDPAAYDPAGWDRYDDLVRGVQARGMGLLFSPTAPIPAWASDCPTKDIEKRKTCKPDLREFQSFMTALGIRYSGTYQDENQGNQTLPRVARFSIWNEPNQPGWLTPQYESKNGRRVATAAHRYRGLVQAAVRGLKVSRSAGESRQILLGETAPIGRTSGTLARRPIPPAEFIRQMLCLDNSGRKQSGTTARANGCTGMRKLAVDGYAHHPYTRGGSKPPRSSSLPNEITIASSSRLKTLLAQGARAKRIPGSLPIFYTEFGYQTNPPDRLFGVSFDEQSEFLNESDWIAFRDPRIKSVAQYKLIDEPNVASFQTGLRLIDGATKPAFDAYRLPLWVVKKGSAVTVYGQVRPTEDDVREVVELQSQTTEGGPWEAVTTIEVTSRKGHFFASGIAAREGRWRLVWAPSDGSPSITSREARAARR